MRAVYVIVVVLGLVAVVGTNLTSPSSGRAVPPEEFAGQEEKHFRVLLAEIVAEAVCSLLISKNSALRPEDYDDFDWDAYYASYTKLMTEFLPIAHESQLKEP